MDSYGHRGMTFDKIATFGSYFGLTSVRPFYLTSMVSRLFGHMVAISPLERLDDLIVGHSRRS